MVQAFYMDEGVKKIILTHTIDTYGCKDIECISISSETVTNRYP